jgi:hypothetical protein
LYLSVETAAPASDTFAASCNCHPDAIVTGSGTGELAPQAEEPPIITPAANQTPNADLKNLMRARPMYSSI